MTLRIPPPVVALVAACGVAVTLSGLFAFRRSRTTVDLAPVHLSHGGYLSCIRIFNS